MTLEEILKCSASELEAMSDAELTEHFSKYFDITRPDRLSARSFGGKKETKASFSPATLKAVEDAKKLGIDLFAGMDVKSLMKSIKRK